MGSFRRLIKSSMPDGLLRLWRSRRLKQMESTYEGLSTKQVFTKIYQDGAWGADSGQRYYSGKGSHEQSIVGPYVEAVRQFLAAYPTKPDVVDLGCGDFTVGSQIRDMCGRYTACDIVDPVIQHNRERFAALEVDFRVLDLTADEPPGADVLFVRQVFQHLSNAQIQAGLERLKVRFKTLIFTEGLPVKPNFTPNLDKPAGPEIRLMLNSGVVLTRPPFNLQVRSEQTICEVPASGGIVRTIVYTLD